MEPVQDQAGFHRFPQPDLVGQQPSNRIGPGGLFGGVQLVGKQFDPASQVRAQPVRLPDPGEVEGVQEEGEIFQFPQVPFG